jgi:hypothetical protein
MRRFDRVYSIGFRVKDRDRLTPSRALFFAVEGLDWARRRKQRNEKLSPERRERAISVEPGFLTRVLQQQRRSASFSTIRFPALAIFLAVAKECPEIGQFFGWAMAKSACPFQSFEVRDLHQPVAHFHAWANGQNAGDAVTLRNR